MIIFIVVITIWYLIKTAIRFISVAICNEDPRGGTLTDDVRLMYSIKIVVGTLISIWGAFLIFQDLF